MDWQNVRDGLAKQFVLEDGTSVVGFIDPGDGKARIVFHSDTGDIEQVGQESGDLGGLSDMIEQLQPEDIIEICCFLDKTDAGAQ